MLRPILRCVASRRIHTQYNRKRYLATVAEESTAANAVATERVSSNLFKPSKNEPLRPHLRIEVREDHGLYHFFRKVPNDSSIRGFEYVTFEAANDTRDTASRSWRTAELRRKNFRDLHVLWYMCRREINLLATQKAHIRRLHRHAAYGMTPISARARMCRKTCARIKFVLNERRLALLNATARIQWGHRPGFKDPAKSPKTKLKKGAPMTEREMNKEMEKLGKRRKLRLLHPELRKRPMLMLKWAPRGGRAKPITPVSDIVAVKPSTSS